MKNNKTKNLLSIFLAGLIIFLSFMPATSNAESNNLDTLEEKQKIEEQFKNVHIENVSSDEVDTSNSIVINSDQEYYELLKQLNDDNDDIVEMDIDSAEFGQNPIEFEPKNPMMLRANYAKGVRYTSKTASKWLGSVPGAPPVKINMCFDYTVKKVKGKWVFKTILKDKRKAWLTGVQFPIAYKWKTISHNYTPNSTRTKVKFTLKGVAGTTVIYKGLPTLLRTNLTYKFSYNITNARE